MYYYVYIIQSEKDNTFYKGYSENVYKRLEQHNQGESHYISFKRPWKLVYFEELPSKREALIREKQIKRYNSDYLRKLITRFLIKTARLECFPVISPRARRVRVPFVPQEKAVQK